MDNDQVLTKSEVVVASSSEFIGLILRFRQQNRHQIQESVQKFEEALDEQLTTRVEQLKTLEAKDVIVGEESKRVLEAFTKNRKKRKLATEGVVPLSFAVYPIYHTIYQDMEILAPRAKAQAESQKRPWVPFQDRLKGWMIERRARRDNSPILHDMYYHHKSGVCFRSKIHVIKFVLHNEYPSLATTDRDDPGAKLKPESGSVKSSKPKRTYKRKLSISSDSPTDESRSKMGYKRKLSLSTPSSSEAPPLPPFAPSSPKRQRTGDEIFRIDIDSPQGEMEAAQAWLTFVKATAPQDATMVMNEEGESRFGELVDQVLDLVAREESEADHQTISNTPDPISSVTDNENANQNQDGSRVGVEVADDGANLAVFSNIEVMDVALGEEESGVYVAEDANHTSKGNDHVECVVGAVTTTNWYMAPMYEEEETLGEAIIRAGWYGSKTLEDPTMPNTPATEGNCTITNAPELAVSFREETHKADNERDDWWKAFNSGNGGDGDLYSIVRPYANVGPNLDRNPNPNPNPSPNPDFKSPPQFRGFDDSVVDYPTVGQNQVADRNPNPNPIPDFKSPQFRGFDNSVVDYATVGPNQVGDRNPNPNPIPDFRSPQFQGFADSVVDYAIAGPNQLGDRNPNPNPIPDFKSPQFPAFYDGAKDYDHLDDSSLFDPSSWDFGFPGPPGF